MTHGGGLKAMETTFVEEEQQREVTTTDILQFSHATENGKEA
jgi:hypothetical protein